QPAPSRPPGPGTPAPAQDCPGMPPPPPLRPHPATAPASPATDSPCKARRPPSCPVAAAGRATTPRPSMPASLLLEDAMNLPLLRRTAGAAALAATAITCAACTVLQPPGHAPARPHAAASPAPRPAGPAWPGLGALLP